MSPQCLFAFLPKFWILPVEKFRDRNQRGVTPIHTSANRLFPGIGDEEPRVAC